MFKIVCQFPFNLFFHVYIFEDLFFNNTEKHYRKSLHKLQNLKSVSVCMLPLAFKKKQTKSVFAFLARLHEVHRAIAVTPVVHVPVPVCVPVPVPVRVTLALKFSRSPYLDNHSSESIHTWTIDTL